LVSAPLWVISGSVVGSDGQPKRGDRVSVAHADGLFGFDPKQLSISPSGTFVVPNLPKGSYCLSVHEGAWPPPRDEIPMGILGARVTIVDRDVPNVRVEAIHMVKATGRLVVDPADWATLQPASLKVAAVPMSADCTPGPQRPGTIRDDLTFEFLTWPGRGTVYLTRVSLNDVPTAVRLDGVEVTKEGIDFRQGQDITGLEITIPKGALASRGLPAR
jgi:hypothetical protein